MKAADFHYNAELQTIICIIHQSALIPHSIQAYLCNKHQVKENILKTALAEIQDLNITWRQSSVNDVLPFSSAMISHLAVILIYYCQLSGCNQNAQTFSKNFEIVQRHQKQIHRMMNHKFILFIRSGPHSSSHSISAAEVIKQMYMQSFFLQSHY